jgi:hypothetical protein
VNPLPLIVAELRHNRLGCAAVVAMIAVAVAIGAALSAQERALTLASTRAVARFDAVVGTAGAPRNRPAPVPIGALWEVHGGPSSDLSGEAVVPAFPAVGTPWLAGGVRPAPALLERRQTVGDAHLLPRQDPDPETKAVVRVAVERGPGAARGNVQDMLRSVTFAFDGLLVTAVLLVIVAVLSARRQSIGALRALGAPPAFVFVTVWLQGALLIAAGILLGMGLGVPLAKAIGAIAGEELGLVVDATIGVPELAYAAVLLGAGSLFAAAPSLPTLRVPVSRLLRAA